jgi:hypothetical protein
MKSIHREIARALYAAVLACAALPASRPCEAQTECSARGYRVVARRWDAILKMNWELRQDCAHPEWPARLAAAGPTPSLANNEAASQVIHPLLVRAGEPVRLWMQDDRVRIEMNGIAEQSASAGQRIVIRVMRQSDDAALTVERITGIVRGAGNVEMER